MALVTATNFAKLGKRKKRNPETWLIQQLIHAMEKYGHMPTGPVDCEESQRRNRKAAFRHCWQEATPSDPAEGGIQSYAAQRESE